MVDTGRTPPFNNPLLKHGYLIKPADRGGGFILYSIKISEEGEETRKPVDLVRQSIKWLTKTANKLKIPEDLLKEALLIAKTTPKKTIVGNDPTVEIYTGNIELLSPDSGIYNGRAYVGIWLPVKLTDPETKISTISRRFYLCFSDGEIIRGDKATLSDLGIHLITNPIYMPPRVSVDTILSLSELSQVDPAELLNSLLEAFMTYIEFDDDRYYVLSAIWVIGTYFYKRFGAYPYLFLNAVKRSGKTKLLTILGLLSYNAVFSPNMSTASLYRLIQNAGCTLLLDETEDLNDPERRADFRSLLLSGYKRGAVVYRSEKDEEGRQTPTPFEVYGPKSLANIEGIEDVLEDRTIPIIMKRGRKRVIINREVPISDPIWVELRDKLTRLFFQEWNNIELTYNGLTPDSVVSVESVESVGSVYPRGIENKKNNFFSGREWELWKPILTIAYTLFKDNELRRKIFFSNPDSPEHTLVTQATLPALISLASEIIKEKETENVTDTGEALLMTALLEIVGLDGYYSLPQIKEAASGFTDQLPEYFNNTWIGKALKRLGFREKRRVSKGMQYKFTPQSVQDMADRLGLIKTETDNSGSSVEVQTTLPKEAED
jgi:hypothetical protein